MVKGHSGVGPTTPMHFRVPNVLVVERLNLPPTEIRQNPLSLQFTPGAGHCSTGHLCAEHLQSVELRETEYKKGK